MNGLNLRIGSLCAGIGGLELGLERAGLGKTVWQVEIDAGCRRVLAKHWPKAKRWRDVKTFPGWSADLVSGGFPCQPFSTAGKRLKEKDPRHLWPDVARAIRLVRPRYVVLENVRQILDGAAGEVLGDLAALGYDAEWDCLPAASIGAPHLRDRWFLIAYPDRERFWGVQPERESESQASTGLGDDGAGRVVADAYGESGRESGPQAPPLAPGWNARVVVGVGGGRQSAGQSIEEVANPDQGGRKAGHELRAGKPEPGKRRQDVPNAHGEGHEGPGQTEPTGRPELGRPLEVVADAGREGRDWEKEQRRGWPIPARSSWWQTQPRLGRGTHGVSAPLDQAAWEKGLPRTLPGKAPPGWGRELSQYGNAVVPQVAEHVGRILRARIEAGA